MSPPPPSLSLLCPPAPPGGDPRYSTGAPPPTVTVPPPPGGAALSALPKFTDPPAVFGEFGEAVPVCVRVCVSVPVLLFWFGWTDRLHTSFSSQDSSQLCELCEHFQAVFSSSALIDFVVDGAVKPRWTRVVCRPETRQPLHPFLLNVDFYSIIRSNRVIY